MTHSDRDLTVIIPTKDRPDDIRALLSSIEAQDILPGRIIIVDSGSADLSGPIKEYSGLSIQHLKHPVSSLPEQRNAGLAVLGPEAEIVAFFDDDIILKEGAIRNAVKKLRGNKKIAGVCLNNISHPRGRVSLLEKIFLVGSDRVGVLLRSGFQSKICSLDADERTEWLLGGATFWRRRIFAGYRFDEWFYGYAHCEDVDFSYSLSKSYELWAIKEGKFLHNTKPIEEAFDHAMGKMQVINRVYFVRKHPELSLALCYWSCSGLFLKNIALGIFGLKPRYLARGMGILAGVGISLYNYRKRIKEPIK
jgi:glycosyltransferase involved in cell wall biosynthesis